MLKIKQPDDLTPKMIILRLLIKNYEKISNLKLLIEIHFLKVIYQVISIGSCLSKVILLKN